MLCCAASPGAGNSVQAAKNQGDVWSQQRQVPVFRSSCDFALSPLVNLEDSKF